MSDIVRVILFPKNAEDPGARQIVLDLAIDASGSVVGPFPAFGRVGDFKRPETLYPFALMGDGRIDFGAYASDSARQDRLAIRSAVLSPGVEIDWTANDRAETFVVDTIVSLVAP